MIFDGKPTSQIDAAEIRQLVEDRTQEDQFVEFKRDPYPASESGRRELIKDVSAFANATGGYILIGIDEDHDGRASAIFGVQDAPAVRSSILDRCLALIDPRLSQLDVGVVDDVEGRSVVVCHVPESDQKPHAAIPDREHHYFYLRYQAGVKLMTVAEVRQALQGDAIQREIAELRRELSAVCEREVVEHELDENVAEERGLLRLASPEAFAQHAEQQFRGRIGARPYFRIAATPVPPNSVDLRDLRRPLYDLLCDPPRYRDHGFDVGARYDTGIRQVAWGLVRRNVEYKHLRLLWNGHLEFWNVADNDWISWAEAPGSPVEERPFAPLSLIESTATFVLLMREIVKLADYEGEIQFELGLYNVKGRCILPYAPATIGRLMAVGRVPDQDELGLFNEVDLQTGPIRERAENLTGTVAFRLIRDLYFELGYGRGHIPFFTQDGRFEYEAPAEQPGRVAR